MKILHLVSSIDPKSGGPTRSITGLCRGLAGCGVDITLFVHSDEHPMQDPSGVRFRAGSGCQIKHVINDVKRMVSEEQPDIVHLHGMWMLSNHIAAYYLRKQNIPYVIAPRGMLEPWSLNAKKWKKRLALWLYQRRDLQHAVALHATAESEAAQFRNLGFKQPIIISPNGVDLPKNMPPRTKRVDGKRTILFLSRIHPKKGLVELVEAWGKVRGEKWQSAVAVGSEGNGRRETGDGRRGERSGSRQWQSAVAVGSEGERGEKWTGTNELLNWHVEYAGPDYGGHLGEVQKRINELGVEEDFTYLGDLSDIDKWNAYRRADVFVLPTYSENFGIVVAEALAAGVPVITTKGTPWAELRGEGSSARVAGWFKGSIRLCPKGYGGQVGLTASFNPPLPCGLRRTSRSNGLVQGVANENNNLHLAIHNSPVEPSSTINYQLSTIADGISNSGRCGWWIDIGVEPLAEALCEAMSLSDEERCAMGENGRRLVESKYTWPAIAEQMKSAYTWILNGGQPPPCVRVS